MWKWPEGKRFAPGHRPWNWQPVGAERIADNGILVKVSETRWRPKHLVEWEAINGPLPQGYKITFIDSNKFNCALDNLKAVPRKGVATEKIGGDGFIYVKEAEGGKWRRKHLVVWESAFGPVPPKFTLLFADGNQHNCQIENLIIAPKSLKKRNLRTMQGLSLSAEHEAMDSLRTTHHQLTKALKDNLLNLLGLVKQNTGVEHGCYINGQSYQTEGPGASRQ